MFDKILVAVGGDDASLEPARVAGQLAAALGAEVSIVCVCPETSETLGEPFYSDLLDRRLSGAEALLEQARQLAAGAGAPVIGLDHLEGQPAERIAEFARHGGFGLVVLGTHRRNRVQSALLGSVSAAVAAHSDLPVLIVHEPH
jgi:nucleotide-binding universal stress UspA family protein